MYRSSLSILLAGSAILLGATHAAGQQLCRPTLSFSEVRFSEIQNQQRTWTAALSVDASRCTATSGRFEIGFDRLKEIAPDMKFVEQFTWKPGRVARRRAMSWRKASVGVRSAIAVHTRAAF